MSTICRPNIKTPEHRVTTEELVQYIADEYRDHPRIEYVLNTIRATTVQARRFSRPLEELARPAKSTGERMREHFRDACRLAEEASRDALASAQVGPQEIDALVCASFTGYVMPGMDIHLIGRLGLPATVRRTPVTQLGCAGGAFALTQAAEHIAAHPDDNVLVVCADVFTPFLHHTDAGMDAMIFRGILGDAAGACVVRGGTRGIGPVMAQSWQYVVPDSADIVGIRLEDDGFHGYNSLRLIKAVESALPHLSDWLRRTCPPEADPVPNFIIAHPGSPRVMDTLVSGLQCDASLLALSRASLREMGNIGSVSLLDVLARVFIEPPASGAHGLVIGVGPGVTLVACRVGWSQGEGP
ncbi:PhlD [Streptomyces sp. NPDC051909]|uniref:type III polyketide synthase n=1 Tax=Streptomyces sp. NPDC051909 TaxID=3154944 RepID=UPI0034380325